METPKQWMDFESLSNSKEFAEFTSLLMRLTGLAMALNSPDGVVRQKYEREDGNQICRRMRESRRGLEKCQACDLRHHKEASQRREPLLYVCHAGFWDMAVPIFVRGLHVATISSGQVLRSKPSEKGFSAMKLKLAWLGFPDKALRKAYFSAPYLRKGQLKHVMRLLELFAFHLCESLNRIRELESRLERDEIRKAKDYIREKACASSLSLPEVASQVGLSVAHFSHIFKQCAGLPFTKFVQERRIDAAKRLLKGSVRSITEICFTCGFSSMTSFNRAFKSVEGLSPREFRRKSCGLRDARGQHH